jgi:hypothetical protein
MEESRNKKWKENPLFKKAMEISELSNKLMEVIREDLEEKGDDELIKMSKFLVDEITTNAFIIPAKIAGAEGADLYNIKMENATVIKIAAQKIQTDCLGLSNLNTGYSDYIENLRNEIEDFRVLFAEWVKSFDQTNYIIDRWGLFNPPGVNYDDYDPDDY